MTLDDFSNGFDSLLGSYTIGNALAFNEYEKSVWLTQAQEEYAGIPLFRTLHHFLSRQREKRDKARKKQYLGL